MSDSKFAVITFDDETKASSYLKGVKDLEDAQQLKIIDAVVVTKDAKGKVKVHETTDLTVGKGATGGGMVGFVIGFFFGGPIGGALLGAAAGALLGKKLDLGISKDKVKAVEEAMQPGSSAIFLQIEAKRVDILAAMVRDLGGEVIDLAIPEDVQMEVNEAAMAARRTGTAGEHRFYYLGLVVLCSRYRLRLAGDVSMVERSCFGSDSCHIMVNRSMTSNETDYFMGVPSHCFLFLCLDGMPGRGNSRFPSPSRHSTGR
ncbi:MAG: DUF1269 domain-containing protein [Chloroflexi bacterium]|nr:DUF1269 domain-containing protein [Chloroflexota bacterium]